MNERPRRKPSDFPRRVLLATIGATPAVLTETLWSLGPNADDPFNPTEIICITTGFGAAAMRKAFLEGDGLKAYENEWGPDGISRVLTEDSFKIVEGPDGPLDDILTREHNAALADLTTHLIRDITQDPDCALHVSIAGGRKTMTFLSGYVLSLFARHQDGMSHVLVDPRFEFPGFLFPPREPREIELRDGSCAMSDEANVTLARVPFVRLRAFLGDKNPIDGDLSYSQVVALAQKLVDPAEMIVDYETHSLICQGESVTLAPALFEVAAYLAEGLADDVSAEEASVNYNDFVRPAEQALFQEVRAAAARDEFVQEDDRRKTSSKSGIIKRVTFESHIAKINRAIRENLSGLAERYVIDTFGSRKGDGVRRGFRLSPSAVQIQRKSAS